MKCKNCRKRLQFGVTKCKSMLVSKNVDTVPSNDMLVDSWTVRHVDNPSTGCSELVEYNEGMDYMEKTEIPGICLIQQRRQYGQY